MPHYALTFDPTRALDHLDSLHTARPKDPSRYDVARRRAEALFAEFETSDDHASLDEGARWTPLFLRTAYVDHGVTVDELTPDVLRQVALRFVLPGDSTSLAHWIAVVHEELVAFLRFLERKGIGHAAACARELEDVVLPEMHERMTDACDAAVDAAPLLPPGSFMSRRHVAGTTPADRRARRKAQRAARKANRMH